jgi:lipopolysaccharide assembly outer membrane protein LptD (OstA)
MSSSKWNKILALILVLAILVPSVAESQRRRRNLVNPNGMGADTVKRDSIKNDSTSAKKDKTKLDAPVNYQADDSIVFTRDGYAHLYGNGKVNYQQTSLNAQIISMNMDSSTVYARGVADSTGTIKGKPEFKDGETPYDSKTIRYNLKSKKGFISNVVTQQGEGYVTGNNAKKGADDELYMNGGRYTTCDRHEHPDFYFQMTRAKVRPKKNIVTGPAYLVVQDVPLPIFVPFFFFPFSE